MPFSLDSNPELSEVAEAVNYLLANFGPNLAADPVTGQITGPQGIVIAYLYRYLSVKYADSFDGSVNFSNTPTNRGYYGVNNSDSTTESTNPADYIWYKVAGGFGTTKFLFYQTTGGRAIDFSVGTTAPSSNYVQDSGSAIDLDVITASVKANSATTAYLIQSQSSPTPSGFPQYTSGSSLPAGWSATLGTVSVGQVVWYTFGTYNGSTVTVNGIPANSTYWSSPIAASVFQDIRSDNWNGSNPPVAGTPSTYGTAGYYIQQSTGNMFLNSVYGRGIADFNGSNSVTGGTSAIVGNSAGNQFYGLFGYAGTGGYGVRGYGGTIGSGVFGSGYYSGVSGDALSNSGYGGEFNNIYGGTGVTITNGKMAIFNSTLVTNLNADYLDGQHGSYYLSTTGTAADSSALGGYAASSWTRIFVGNTGTANAAGSGMNFQVTFAGYQFRGTSNYMYLETVSDERIKKDIEPEVLGLDFIKQLKPVTYRMKDGVQTKFHGFIAQDVEKLISGNGDSLKTENEEGIKGVDYISLIAPLTKAIQELTAKVEELERKNAA